MVTRLTQLSGLLCALEQIIRLQKPSRDTWWSVVKGSRVTEFSSFSGLLITTSKISGLERFLCEYLLFFKKKKLIIKISSDYKSNVKVFHCVYLVLCLLWCIICDGAWFQ